jgi:hypothetical protein
MNPTIQDRRSPVTPAGDGKGAWLRLLELGAGLLQDHDPMRGFDAYVVGFHCARDEPSMQMEAHHYCRVVNDDFLQCVIFDGNTRSANLIGVEYIVSEKLFETLPPASRSSGTRTTTRCCPASWWRPACPTWPRRRSWRG